MEPVNRLSLTFRAVRPVREDKPEGMEPVNRFPLTSRLVREVREDKPEGIWPVSRFPPTFRAVREVREPRPLTADRSPPSRLPDTSRLVKAVRPVKDGMEPDNRLPPRFRAVNPVRAPRAGMEPDNRLPLRFRVVRVTIEAMSAREPVSRFPLRFKAVRAPRVAMSARRGPIRFPSDRSRPVTRPPETVTPGQVATSPAPQARRGWSAANPSLSGLLSHWLRIPAKITQSGTSRGVETISATQVPSVQEATSNAASVPSLPGIVTCAPTTSQSVAEPDTAIRSAPSSVTSLFTVRVKDVEALLAWAGMTIWNGSGRVAVKSCPEPSVAWPGPEPPAAVRVTVNPPAGATSPAGNCAVTVTTVGTDPSSRITGGDADSATADSSSTMVSGSAESTLKAAARPEKTTDSEPSRNRSSTGDRTRSA